MNDPYVKRDTPSPFAPPKPPQNDRRKTPPHGNERARDVLPIEPYEQTIRETIRENESSILVGETGSGKSTKAPQFILAELGPGEKAAVTEPRRVAVRSVSRYVAEQRGEKIGGKIGFQIRFEDQTNEDTRINFMTDGILLRKLQQDPMLREYTVVMVDEAHERSLNIDFTLGLLKRAQRLRREAKIKPLKILVASATLEKEKFAKFFDDAPIVEVPGRLYDVEVHYEEETPEDYTEAAAYYVHKILRSEKPGNILIFMPGKAEIGATIKEIEKRGDLSNTMLMPLYGEMAPEDQDRIFQPSKERKIVVSTNIAETSVTVPGLRFVIDSGLINQTHFNTVTGIQSLDTVRHAKSGCEQRTGRAGRVAPGECYRLFTKVEYDDLQSYQTPEIKRSNLDHVILAMKKMGIEDVEAFEFIDPPERSAIHQAIDTLQTLGALDEQGHLTKMGETMADIPLEPKLARMVIEAQKYGCVENVCTIAAFIGLRSVFVRPKDKELEADAVHANFRAADSDFLTLLNVWEAYERQEPRNRDRWASDHFLHKITLREIQEVRFQLFRVLRQKGIDVVQKANGLSTQKSIAAGLMMNLMVQGEGFSYVRVSDNKEDLFIHPSSTLFTTRPSCMTTSSFFQKNKTYATLCQRIQPEWIREIAPQLVEEGDRRVFYDTVEDEVVQTVELHLKKNGKLIGTERKRAEKIFAAAVFAEAMADELIDLPCVQHNRKVVDQLTQLHHRTRGKITIPKVSQWYAERLKGIRTKREAEKIEEQLQMRVEDFYTPEMREETERDYPASIEIGGEQIWLTYEFRPENTSGWTKEERKEKFTIQAYISKENLEQLKEPLFVGPPTLREPVEFKVSYQYRYYTDTDPARLRAQLHRVIQEETRSAYTERMRYENRLLPAYESSFTNPLKVSLGDRTPKSEKKISKEAEIKPTPPPVEQVKETMTDALRQQMLFDLGVARDLFEFLRNGLLPLKQLEKLRDEQKKQLKVCEAIADRLKDLRAVVAEVEKTEDVARARGLVGEIVKKAEKAAQDLARFTGETTTWVDRFKKIMQMIPGIEEDWGGKLADESRKKIIPRLVAMAKRTDDLDSLKKEIGEIVAEGF